MAELINIPNVGNNTSFNLSRITLFEAPNVENIVTSQINQNLDLQELKILQNSLSANLPFELRLSNIFNAKKGEIQARLIPFIVKQLSPFGSTAVQFIASNPNLFKQGVNPQDLLPILNELKDYIVCPSKAAILQLINKRNNTATQINNLYQTVKVINKTTDTTNTILNAIQIGITVIRSIPYPATGVPPVLPPLTTGIIETVGAVADLLQTTLNANRIVLSNLNLTAASFGTLLGSALNLLNILDVLIQQCAQDQEIPFTAINNELNLLNNQSQIIAQTQNDLTYKGFKLEIKLDEANQTKYPRRYAQALNLQGVPVLRTESSFASNPQVLVDQLKFIIDSNPNLTAE